MRDGSSSLRSRAGRLALSLLFLASQSIWQANAFTFTSIPSPNLNLNGLGKVAFAGDFDSISLYQYEGQNEQSTGTNGAVLSRFPNGVFANISQTDGDIRAMCAFQANGTLQGIVFGGNFTSVNGMNTSGGVALLNPDTGNVTALPGLTGSVNALYCDADRGRVFLGGSFTGGGASNAIVWITGWTNMPFSGFNGPVNSITKAPNGKIVFGGVFNGLGGNSSAPRENNTQVLPIGSANLTAQTSSGRPGFTEPQNIVCKQGESQGSGQTWLLADDTAGFWKADFGFGFQPTKLRLHNTNFEDRGTKTWRYTALPDGGIMNFTYTDPSSGQQKFCDARCPLPQNNVTAQDFGFVNIVGMNSFKIDISEWYGAGGGLNGIELFQDDVFAYAINEFNEPKCGGVTTGATSSPTGPWVVTPSGQSQSQYLTARLTGDTLDPNSTFVVFSPDVPQSGNYSVQMFTPGCQGDGTCGTRGIVNITGSMAKSSSASKPISTTLYQTNLFDKYDTIFEGYIDATDGFRPQITLAPAANQGRDPLTIVAQRAKFILKSASSGNLNGLFEYDPGQQEVTNNLSDSVIDAAGASLSPRDDATVTALSSDSSRLFVGGNFSGDGFNNIFAIDETNSTALPGAGLDNQVLTMYINGSILYVGGNFTKTSNGETLGLNGVAAFSTSDNKWSALGAGVEGVVMYIVPFSLNITANTPEQVIGISGFFDRVNGFGTNQAFSAQNFAVWVPSRQNWLHNLNIGSISLQGALTAFTDIPGADTVFGGSINSQELGASGAASLQPGSPLSLNTLPATISAQQQQQASLRKRAIMGDRSNSTTGVVAATFYHENQMNKTILAGHFAATDTDGQNITNLLIIDNKDNNRVRGLDEGLNANSTFQALGVLSPNKNTNVLFAGGSVTGTINNNRINGIIAYDFGNNRYAGSQPPALQGVNVTVNAIAARPKSQDVYVAGQFESAGSLSCSGLCIWNTELNQWVSPGSNFGGVVTSMTWISDTKLLVAGNLTSGGNQTKIVTYDSSKSTFTDFNGARDLPGSVTALCIANTDGSQIWATGQGSDGSTFLQKYDGSKWTPVTDAFGQGTNVRGIQVLTLSKDHGNSDLIGSDQDLLILGQINVPNFGTASGVLYNGSTIQPFLLSTTSSNTPGSLSQVFVENPQNILKSSNKHLALGFIVLIALAIALALTFLLVVAGILVEWYRKRSKGYVPAPTSYPDRGANMSRVPPEHLFGGTLSANRPPAI
ncbi:cortical protein marker for cell polarity-domain-containing protein [Lophiotrema nucula]|uniref:Cortical protein marker for cell polarity-domain-containing protein n=1 Tax=Lophiotrema nucula TaxID=690887 RepID=A0A6A5ZJZ4_9PLEO|nr:cortical protein marker for cell polarity-domain-containing protein [Lophiotrema nucula]